MKYVLHFFLLGYLAMSPYARAQDKSMELLKKINHAANSVNYDGVFLHIDETHIHSLRVIHKIKDGSVRERLYALNGVPREVIRDDETVWCFMPDKKMGHAGLRSGKENGFPGFMVKSLAGLSDNYKISVSGTERIADRNASRLQILPRDGLRYGYELWADESTGLLLKSALIDYSGKTIEQYMFAMVEIGVDIPDSALMPMTKKATLEWHSNKVPAVNTPVKDSDWTFSILPEGYRLVSVFQRSMPMEENRIVHMILSDGLAGVSVFIEKSKHVEPEHEEPGIGLNKMGAVYSYSRLIDGHLATVIGEVPASAIKAIGDALTSKASLTTNSDAARNNPAH